MATGSSTYDGLAMGLFGEHQLTQQTIANDILTITSYASNTSDYLVLEDSDGTEQFYINYLGAIYIRNSLADTAGTGAYMGIDARSEILDGATGTWYAGAGFRLTQSSTHAGQSYAGNFHFIGSATGGAGRTAAIQCVMAMATGYEDNNISAFFNLNDSGTQNVNFLFMMPETTTADDVFAANTASAATHALQVQIGSTSYYLMLTTCTGY